MTVTLCRRSAILALVLSAAVLVLLSVRAADSAAPPASAPERSAQLPEDITEAFGLDAGRVVTVDVSGLVAGGSFATRVVIDGQPRRLELHPHSVRADGYHLLVQQPDGSLEAAPPGVVRTFRGRVAGFPDSIVAGSVLEDGLHAEIRLALGDDAAAYRVEPLSARIAEAGPDAHVVYQAHEISLQDRDDIMLALPAGADDDASPATTRRALGGAACGTGLCQAELACDADFEYFQAWGSVAAVEARINNVINTMNVQYETEVDITHAITAIIVRTAEPDPYSSTDAVTLLNQFRNHWLSQHGGIQRDVAELFTGKNLDGTTVGIAWVGAVCTSYGFSVVQSDCCGSLSCATDLSAHELGHNWAADHCSCSSYTMNSFLTCGNQFHPTSTIPEIISHRDSRGCLQGVNSCGSDADCDDGDLCTADSCNAGSCVFTPVDCDDGDACTLDGCDPAAGTCVYDAVDCDDADACTVDSCDPLDGCLNDPVICPPGQTCVDGVCQVCNSDGACDPGEDCNTCGGDCPSGGGAGCGNGVCEPVTGEDCLSCPADCNGKQNGNPNKRFCCGDGGGQNPVDCQDPRCHSDGYNCGGSPDPFCCGDGLCEGLEDSCTCAIDCGPPQAGEVPNATCQDGLDNDCDGNADCSDPDCDADDVCSVTCVPTHSKEKGPRCSDGLDNDCDGLIDGADPDC